ncbi:hypothetical protein EJ06DRAFT_170400 [Trichodelitschia bisporula]|uniref:Uncharacterized protein n=1 Tax=Trichodelitschia bisporula TaxID=703511 RepID=A0A6G1HLM0_9PEZI|nr:hypothetical protein EJ06DRAFT_170400 [Trichodelitschia bisporula]
MTALLTRSPLQSLSMSSSQRATRRSTRHVFDDDDPPPAKRTKLDGASAMPPPAKKANGRAAAATSKRKNQYDEDEDGFKFTRARSKKAQPRDEAPTVPEPKPAKTAPARTKRKAGPATLEDEAVAPPVAPPVAEPTGRRRSARLSGDKVVEPPVPVRRPKKTLPTSPEGSPPPTTNGLEVDKQREGTKIALPFADTPVIRRNKEMRDKIKTKNRRSSTGMRGRRASSLIESGTSNGGQFRASDRALSAPPRGAAIRELDANFGGLAVPHADVEASEFYKHIEQSLPEPRRMKQLLTWCGARALPEKVRGGMSDLHENLAVESARHIQEELLRDFANKSEMSNWFDRDTTPKVIVKTPNPRNIQNAAKIEELEAEIQRLQDEKRTWESLLKSSSQPPLPPSTDPISASALSESQTPHLSLLTNPTPAPLPRLQSLSTSLEQHIDAFASGIHRLSAFRTAADATGYEILDAAVRRLEARQKAAAQAAGTAGVSGARVLGALGKALGERGM